MTGTYDLTKVTIKGVHLNPFLQLITRYERELDITWLTTGFYIFGAPPKKIERGTFRPIELPHLSFSIEPEHLDKVIELYPGAPERTPETTFTPYYQSMIWNRGMFVTGNSQILAYKATLPAKEKTEKKEEWVILHDQDDISGIPSSHISELMMPFEDLKKIQEILKDHKLDGEKPIHYCNIS